MFCIQLEDAPSRRSLGLDDDELAIDRGVAERPASAVPLAAVRSERAFQLHLVADNSGVILVQHSELPFEQPASGASVKSCVALTNLTPVSRSTRLMIAAVALLRPASYRRAEDAWICVLSRIESDWLCRPRFRCSTWRQRAHRAPHARRSRCERRLREAGSNASPPVRRDVRPRPLGVVGRRVPPSMRSMSRNTRTSTSDCLCHLPTSRMRLWHQPAG